MVFRFCRMALTTTVPIETRSSRSEIFESRADNRFDIFVFLHDPVEVAFSVESDRFI